jgi:hypothetical protein
LLRLREDLIGDHVPAEVSQPIGRKGSREEPPATPASEPGKQHDRTPSLFCFIGSGYRFGMNAKAMSRAMKITRKKATVPTSRHAGGLRPECDPPSESLVIS